MKKHIISFVTLFCLLFSLVPNVVFADNNAEFAGGSGTEDDPYLIATAEHLDNVRNHLDAHFKMITDIEFTEADFAEGGRFYNDGQGWESIVETRGSYYDSFCGVFDGNNHYIDGLRIYEDSSNLGFIGLFGANNGEIKNLEMRSTVISTNTNRGAFVGCIAGKSSGKITNCKAQGEIVIETAQSYAGPYIGGIVGHLVWSDIVSCTSNVNISGNGAFDCVGGICGSVQEGCITKSINYGSIKGTYNVGGIAGDIVESTLSECGNFGNVKSSEFSAILPDGSGVDYQGESGGIVAHSNSKDLIVDCFNAGEITSDGTVGGIVGFAGGTDIENSYNVGTINATIIGGIIGSQLSATSKNCYYIDTTLNEVGYIYSSWSSSSRRCTSQEMKNQETFKDFDFSSIWVMGETNYLYPVFRYNYCYFCEHNLERVAPVLPSCETEGNIEHQICKKCGAYLDITGNNILSEAETVLSELGHNEIIDKAVAATCTETGLTEGKHCSVCNTILVAQTEIPATDHTEVIDAAKAPTCTTTGLTEGKHCSVCNEILVAQEVIDAFGHTEVVDKAVVPNCTTTGLTEGKHCSVCNVTLIAQEVIDALGHTEVVDKAVVPTCTSTGLTEGQHCSVCNAIIIKQEVVPIISHNYRNGECSSCGKIAVNRIFGTSRYDTAFAISDALKEKNGGEKFDSIIISSGTNFPDALSGSYLAAVKNAPILITDGTNADKLLAYIHKNLASNGTVYILGGVVAVPENVEDLLISAGINVERLSGKTRYLTNIAILNEAGVSSEQEVLICSGASFPDALSVSATGLPILLVGNSLTQEQIDFLCSTSGKFVIIGGEVAVNSEIEAALNNIGVAERVYGKSRYDTSVAVARRFFTDPDEAIIAYGRNFPDGLCGGALAYSMNAPLLLTERNQESAVARYCADNGINHGAALGGTVVLTDDTISKIFD